MVNLLKDFFHSQLFGIILGTILTGGFTILCEKIRANREDRIYLKRSWKHHMTVYHYAKYKMS